MIRYNQMFERWEDENGTYIQGMSPECKENCKLIFDTKEKFWEWWDNTQKIIDRPDKEQYRIFRGEDWFSIYLRDLERYCDYIEREQEKYKTAIQNCIDTANNRESEWGTRAEKSFEFLYDALYGKVE